MQFQGMIAEYERAQILERSRRGKRHRARQGEVSVLSGAPFGYRFIRKTDHSAAHHEIDEEQARIVRQAFELYSVQGLSIGLIARLMNERAVPTCKRRGRWSVRRCGACCVIRRTKVRRVSGKTTIAPRERITRPIRMRGGVATRNSASHERAREDRDHHCGAANRQRGDLRTRPGATHVNKIRRATAHRDSQCRARARELHQVRLCHRTSTRSSARKIHDYRCLGSSTPIGIFLVPSATTALFARISLTMWLTEIVRLLEDPRLIQNESSSGVSWRLARLIRQNVATRRSGVIWSVSAKPSIVC